MDQQVYLKFLQSKREVVDKMDFKFTKPKSLFDMVTKDFKGSFDDKVMSLSGMMNPSLNYSRESAGKRRRMYEIGQNVLRKEMRKARTQIRKMDASPEEKRKADAAAQKQVEAIDTQFKNLLGFKK